MCVAFERMDATAGVKRLVPKAVDPELLEAVVGPRLASTWVEPLRAQYSRFKQAYPKGLGGQAPRAPGA